MNRQPDQEWAGLCVSASKALQQIDPGMCIFLSTGPAEPRTLIQALMEEESGKLQDLELLQLVSFGDAISLETIRSQKFRLKTFFSGWVASEAITQGQVDLIPSRFSRVPELIRSGRLPIDAAFVQVSTPDSSGYCSLGLAVDVAREAMDQAEVVIGEINPDLPRTFGDTFVHLSEFTHLVRSQAAPFLFPRWPEDAVHDRIGENVASIIDNGSCLAFSLGPIYEAVSRHLRSKRHLGIHTPFFSDALMELVQSGAVDNRNKRIFTGKSVTSFAIGSAELHAWLDRNPFVDFQPMGKVFDPVYIGRNPSFVTILPARKVDLSGRIALHSGKGNVTAGPGEATDFVNGAELSAGGMTVIALPSQNLEAETNIRLSVEQYPNLFSLREAVDAVVTEYGVAWLRGRSVRERAMSLIDIAHPEHRMGLVNEAKEARILYADQVYLESAGKVYPEEIVTQHRFKGDTLIRFRPIKPSDEDEMRRLFYRFSDEAVYYRYFTPVKAMPHSRMQEYVNIDYQTTMSVVGVVGPKGEGHIVAEGRYVKYPDSAWADLAFLVDEEYQGLGVATYLFQLLVRVAKDRCLQGFTADVLVGNKGMLRVFEKGSSKAEVHMEGGVYSVRIPFEGNPVCSLEELGG
ncbi:bifunctional acetyl-CoA hydrolase/transferase family protein/GNAT family N-acetyltransferase [Desulfovermiculus halophilus]|jgi:acyl-CoA hydrolase|uniref:bifunctional acetyl-CoA hydrolase/transferase family protein/GNAT family N-acetyltransferase n=1 Tax=Desulfovermiculus halophilus TaxID=339722 RepID=UPI000482C99B|nr:bifunctional acetyl-CoA hydrolase/transferase family protein/GNAT family N-acetyltransferase [Desulfovermiculus halophilus]